ncbi:MAG: ABC transporter-related protein [Methanoculleus marisnigri]|uniref:ABC transporter-related protein n=1 Tax=Methanoculleus marisnigri TaxID=2198 RepID=A0A117MGK2_9EURY|nr:MAG: ABC transporter-related protein [Methanoculleus marisnigri]
MGSIKAMALANRTKGLDRERGGEREGEKVRERAIVVENVSKRFRIPHEKRVTFFDHLIGLAKGGSYSYEEFLALNDVSFSVNKGETFGVIGPNGCGKSTLLKILAGVLYPDTGHVKIDGKIAPFLELGVGFQPDLTALENIRLYGAVMGLTRKQIEGKREEILEFSELKRFENMKLKNFSSGMYVKLAFSTAIQTDPDVLLVDEVLSVGDEAFQKKCAGKIEEIRRAGKTIVFVSHALGTVRDLCERCILLDAGRIIALGDAHGVVDEYMRVMERAE